MCVFRVADGVKAELVGKFTHAKILWLNPLAVLSMRLIRFVARFQIEILTNYYYEYTH